MERHDAFLGGETPEKSLETGGHAVAIRAEKLVKRFGGLEALAQVSVTIKRGEFFSLLGPSGCGKTTLLRIIAGLETPDSGTLMIGDRDATGLPAHKRPVNTVFQSYALFPHLDARENIAFGLRMKKVRDSEIRRRVDAMMEVVRVAPFASRKPDQMSGGQRQRVALARALVNEPQVLLLDEPLGALDLKLRRELQIELMRLQRRLGTTFIFVTHDQEEALVMSDRIAVMNSGRIEQLDSGLDLYEKPRTPFVAKFLGSCNLIAGTVSGMESKTEGWLETVIGILQFNPANGRRGLKNGENISLAFRPEKLAMHPKGEKKWTNAFKGVIEEIVYSGAQTHYRVRVGNLTLNVGALNSLAGTQGFAAGQGVSVTIPPDALVVLDDDASAKGIP